MAPPDAATQATPLAPSVEKAYYRKCIELKRRLHAVEASNDDLKVRRVRLDRAVMKMRLERAFLLEQLSKRMDHNVDGSDGSGDEGLATPPPDRPHRDKRRRPHSHLTLAPAPPSSHASYGPPYPPHHSSHQQAPPGFQRVPSDPTASAGSPPLVEGPGGARVPANAVTQDGQYVYDQSILPSQPHQHAAPPGYAGPPAALPSHTSPYGAPVGVPGATSILPSQNGISQRENADDRQQTNVNRGEGVTGEALSAGPTIREDANGERRLVSDSATAEMDTHRTDAANGSAGGGFTAVNQ